ncbi:MAG: methyl-accepting chemotaxis protein, partial [Planctomycetes bacterium]|nr:methyl-accepting chemotaxis protein [Planctomycetota bacterium]
MSRFRLSIGSKIYCLLALSFVGLVGLAAVAVDQVQRGLKEQKRIELRHLTEIAIGIVKEEHARIAKEGVKPDDAKARAAARVAALRYGDDDYFWINDMHPRMVMHPMRSELNGRDLSDNKDPNGKRLFVDFVQTVRASGNGYVDYEWPKPGADKPQPKVSYVAGFEPWGWVIGTGVYVDDLRAQVWQAAQRLLGVAALIFLFSGAIAVVAARNIARPIRRIAEVLLQLAGGNKAVEIGFTKRGDEVGEAARAAVAFKESLEKMDALEAEQRASQQRAAAERRAEMERLSERIRASVGSIVEGINTLSFTVGDATRTMQRNAGDTHGRISHSSQDLNSAASDVSAVATAVTELATSVSEISAQTVHSTKAAAEVSSAASMAEQVVEKLTETSQRIGDISSLINSIAAQTNLLALN